MEDFRECLNSVHPRVQFTMEEDEENSIAFLDVHITRQNNGTLTTKIFRKPSNTNIGIKPQSCQDPKIVIGELGRCYRLCTTTEQAKKEIEYTLDLFEDNGEKVEILPGMVASVDVLAGKRTVLDYIWNPMMKVKDKALTD